MGRKDAFRRAMESYLEEVATTRAAHTLRTYTHTLNRLHKAVRAAGVTTYIQRWTLEDVMDVLAQRGHLLPGSRLLEVTVLRRMLLFAGVDVLDRAIRTGRFKLPRRSQVNVRWYDEMTIAMLRAHADDVEYVIVVLASELGLRREEVARLRVTDIHGDVLIVRGKGEKMEPVPLTPSVYTTLERWLVLRRELVKKAIRRNPEVQVPEEVLIYERGGRLSPYSPEGIRWRVRRAGQRIGRPVSPHDLRRSCGRLVYLATKDIVAVNRLLRHESLETTRKYIGADVEDARAAMEARAAKRRSIAPLMTEPVNRSQ